jgi:hypothetical protein
LIANDEEEEYEQPLKTEKQQQQQQQQQRQRQLPNNEKFNRGILLNIGYYIAKQNCNYDRYIFHDVDSYPPQPLFDLYFQYINYNIHYASSYLDYKYKYDQFLGGVVGLTSNDFEKINGYPNTFLDGVVKMMHY